MKTEKHQQRKTNSLNLNPPKSGPKLGLRCCGLLAALALVLGITPRAQGTITVTSLNDSGPGSLRQAIADAPPGDIIGFAVTGTITLTSGQLALGKNLTIAGPGVASLTINGNHASRVLLVTNGTVFISSLTISNGYASGSQSEASGGGIANSSTLTISNCCITAGNVFSSGGNTGPGGIANGGNLTIVDSTVSKNGFYMVGVNRYVTSYWTGGIFNSGTLKLVRSAVIGNAGIVSGGVLNGALMYATNSTFSSNWGTGIYNNGGTLWLYNSTVCLNKSGEYTDCGIVNSPPSPWAGLTYFANSIVAGNGFVDLYGPSGSFVSQDYNLIQNTNYATITGVTTHNIYGKDPLLGPLADNGGPTLTHALLPGSPAIDHGSSGGMTTDQRGQPRPVRFPAYFAADDGSDIGAYELQERPQTNWVVNGSSSNLLYIVNSTNDVDDGVPGIAHCSLREAIHAANAVAGTNTTMINFATNVPGLYAGVTGTITLTNGELLITKSVNVSGPGTANLTVSGNNSSRVFDIYLVPLVSISGLTIANGNSGYNDGGGIYNYNSPLTIGSCMLTNNRASYGSAIYNKYGPLTMLNSMVCSNANINYGAIWNDGGTLSLASSTVFNNYTRGIQSGSSGTVNLTNSTISGNLGGGIGGGNFDTIRINSCTIVSNSYSGSSTGGGIDSSGSVAIRNSILAGNSGTFPHNDFYAYLTSEDYNLIGNPAGGFILGTTNHCIYNQDPKLGPLAYLGGPTRTHALRYDSPAIDTGNSGGLTTDQRGLPRPIGTAKVAGGDGSDIGAYEADPNLRITTLAKTGGDMRMQFNTLLGRNYRVESGDAITGPWKVVSNNIPGTGGTLPVVDTGAASLPRRFYRGVVLLP